MATISFSPLNETADVALGTNLLDVLLSKEYRVRSLCRGRGICATCHVKVRSNGDRLSPRTAQELKTLSLIANSDAHSRLACQSNVCGEGVVIELPSGIYIENLDDLLDLVGDRAVADYLHPVNGTTLIPKDKIITRSLLNLFKSLTQEVNQVK